CCMLSSRWRLGALLALTTMTSLPALAEESQTSFCAKLSSENEPVLLCLPVAKGGGHRFGRERGISHPHASPHSRAVNGMQDVRGSRDEAKDRAECTVCVVQRPPREAS